MKTKIIFILCLISVGFNIWSFSLERRPKLKKVHLMHTFTIGWHEGYQRGLKDQIFSDNPMKEVHERFVLDSLDLEMSIFLIK